MNLNKKIAKFSGDGIPAYNAKFDELIDAVNWLAGLRTINGKPVAESDQGPVIDLSQVSATQALTAGLFNMDPDGNQAGWSLITCLNLDTKQSFETWIWTGQVAKNILPIRWLTDPANNPARWVVCIDNSFWGTGSCPSGKQGFENANFTGRPQGANPAVITFTPQAPIVPPTGGSTFYLVANDYNHGTPPSTPVIYIGNNNPANSGVLPLDFNYNITYEGVTIFDITPPTQFVDFGNTTGGYYAFQLPTSGWVFDPSGVPGYSHGNLQWVYEYNGPPTNNPNPVVVETLTFAGASVFLYILTVVYLTG
jgi:hypothetical protein